MSVQSRLRTAALLLALAALAACTTTSTISGPVDGVPGPGTPIATGVSKDRVTASDESDATRRGRARLELASAYFGEGQLETALDEVKLAINADSNSGQAYNLRGLIYSRLGDERLAEESFRRALQIDGNDADALHNFGWFQCQRQRYGESDALFAQALAVPRYRGVSRSLLAQGVCQARSGKLVEAERTLLKSLEADATNPSTAVNLAEVLYRRADYDRARFYIRRVNNQGDMASAQTLWLGMRIEQRLDNRNGVEELGARLRQRFPKSPEAGLYERRAFDE
jgi:type IV pilus assembly protein PilF